MVSRDDIQQVLGGMLAGIAAENEAVFTQFQDSPALQRAVAAVQNDRPDEFNIWLTYPMGRMVKGLLQQEVPQSEEAQFLFKEARFVESHYQKLIEKFEGSACCADKSRTLVRSLARSFKTGQDIVFDYTQEYTYHLPKKVFTTHEEIMTFFKALHHLYYGNGEPYLQAMSELYNRVLAKNARDANHHE